MITKSLAAQLYEAYGEARDWERSGGEPMEKSIEQLPMACQRGWQAVADTAIKICKDT